MLLLVDRRRDALLDRNPPEPSPMLTEEEWGVDCGANVVRVEEKETRGVSDEGVELVLSWLSRIKQGGVPLRSRMRSIFNTQRGFAGEDGRAGCSPSTTLQLRAQLPCSRNAFHAINTFRTRWHA